MIDHPSPTLIEELAIGALDDEAVIAHCAACDVCADRLAREARLELALGEVHAFRAGHRGKHRQLLRIAPLLAFAAAAAILFAIRRSAPPTDVQPDPSTRRAAVATVASGTTPSDVAEVIAALRPRFKACYQENLRAGGPTDGKAILQVKVDGDGNVLDVTVDSNTGFSAGMATCLVEVLHRARFAGTGRPVTVNVPVTFTAQR